MTVRKYKGRFRPGDWAVWMAGPSRHVVQILENVGPVVRDGPPFYRFQEIREYGEPVESEMPENYLEPALESEIPRSNKRT